MFVSSTFYKLLLLIHLLLSAVGVSLPTFLVWIIIYWSDGGTVAVLRTFLLSNSCSLRHHAAHQNAHVCSMLAFVGSKVVLITILMARFIWLFCGTAAHDTQNGRFFAHFISSLRSTTIETSVPDTQTTNTHVTHTHLRRLDWNIS